MKIVVRLSLALISVVLSAGCSSDSAETITIATTTSTRDSGLMDVLVPMFEQQSGISVKVVAAGSGQALEIGRRGDADLLLTHAPAAEQQFVADGFGRERTFVMFNDFVLVGPVDDPADVKEIKSIEKAFAAIARRQAPFVSRGDDSGTHMKEQAIWKQAAIEPNGDWYIVTGAGMAQTLRVAYEKRTYALTDRGTFLAHQDKLDLVVLSEGDEILRNEYSVTLINPTRHPHVKHLAARRFLEFLLAKETQNAIAGFGVAEYGQPLFFPGGDRNNEAYKK